MIVCIPYVCIDGFSLVCNFKMYCHNQSFSIAHEHCCQTDILLFNIYNPSRFGLNTNMTISDKTTHKSQERYLGNLPVSSYRSPAQTVKNPSCTANKESSIKYIFVWLDCEMDFD